MPSFALITINSVEPNATSFSPRISTKAVLPFSRQGVILAMIVSPLQNFEPPENGAFSVSGIFFVKGSNLSIATFVASVPFFMLIRGLNSIKSAARISVHCSTYFTILSDVLSVCQLHILLLHHCIVHGRVNLLMS